MYTSDINNVSSGGGNSSSSSGSANNYGSQNSSYAGQQYQQQYRQQHPQNPQYQQQYRQQYPQNPQYQQQYRQQYPQNPQHQQQYRQQYPQNPQYQQQYRQQYPQNPQYQQQYRQQHPQSASYAEAQTQRGRLKKAILTCFGVAAFCVLFCFLYEQFSYGEYSSFMRRMFLVPLAGGGLPYLLIMWAGDRIKLPRVSFNLWNAGLAAIASGCLIRGIIEISGRSTEYDTIYWALGGILCAAAIVTMLFGQDSGDNSSGNR